MKLKMMIFAILTAIVIFSCTPEIEDDSVRIDFSRNNQYLQYYSDTTAVLVKAHYHASPSRNGVFLEDKDTTFTANALFFRTSAVSPWTHHYTFGSDSNMYAAKRDGSKLYFRYDDTLLYIIDLKYPAGSNPDSVIITEFDTLLYPEALSSVATDSTDIEYIDSLNNSAKWYKPYGQWKDEIINLYR